MHYNQFRGKIEKLVKPGQTGRDRRTPGARNAHPPPPAECPRKLKLLHIAIV